MVQLDFRNRVTPFALLEVIRIFKRMAPGEAFEIRGNDQDLRQDLNRILPEDALRVVVDDLRGEYVARICKTAPRTAGDGS